MKTLLRQDFKRLLKKNPSFREYFPEYKKIFDDIDTGRIRIGCCGFSESLYNMCINMVLKDLDKWKIFLRKNLRDSRF